MQARPRLAVLLALSLSLACAPGRTASTSRPSSTAGLPPAAPGWRVDALLSGDDPLGGCAVGDFSAATPGNEVAAVGASGAVYLARREAGGWRASEIARLPGEMIQCAGGDALPDRPGDELLVFGMLAGDEADGGRGAAYLLHEAADGCWVVAPVLEDDALVHGGCIADVDPRYAGSELVLAGFGRTAFVAHATPEGWQAERALALPAAGKNAVAFDGGAAIGLRDGELLLLRREGEAWTRDLLDRAPPGAGQSRLAAAGSILLVARDDGVLAWLEAGTRTEVLHEEAKLRGAALGDLDPAHPGIEVATGGYACRLSVLRRDEAGWSAEVVLTLGAAIHHVAAGDLDPTNAADELVLCGHGGQLLLVTRTP